MLGIIRLCLSSRTNLFLLSFLLVFDHLLQLVIGCSILCLQLLTLDSQITAKLLDLNEMPYSQIVGQDRTLTK